MAVGPGRAQPRLRALPSATRCSFSRRHKAGPLCHWQRAPALIVPPTSPCVACVRLLIQTPPCALCMPRSLLRPAPLFVGHHPTPLAGAPTLMHSHEPHPAPNPTKCSLPFPHCDAAHFCRHTRPADNSLACLRHAALRAPFTTCLQVGPCHKRFILAPANHSHSNLALL